MPVPANRCLMRNGGWDQPSILVRRLKLLSSRKNLTIALPLATLAVVLGAFGIWRGPQSLEIDGYAGNLGEWELTATVSQKAPARMRELSGPLIMKHIGLCSQDGPEEKAGEMRLRLSLLSSRIEASLSIEGVACTYNGPMHDFNSGTLICPDRRAIPLTLWIKQ